MHVKWPRNAWNGLFLKTLDVLGYSSVCTSTSAMPWADRPCCQKKHAKIKVQRGENLSRSEIIFVYIVHNEKYDRA